MRRGGERLGLCRRGKRRVGEGERLSAGPAGPMASGDPRHGDELVAAGRRATETIGRLDIGWSQAVIGGEALAAQRYGRGSNACTLDHG